MSSKRIELSGIPSMGVGKKCHWKKCHLEKMSAGINGTANWEKNVILLIFFCIIA